jgi:hypothetical protein
MFRMFDSGYWHHMQIRIPNHIKKIVYFNEYKPQIIRYSNGDKSKHYVHTKILSGITASCLCNPDIESKIVGENQMIVEIVQSPYRTENRYYLKQLSVDTTRPDHLFLYLEKRGTTLSLQTICAMQLRATNYVNCGYEAVLNMDTWLPRPIQEMMTTHAFISTFVFTNGRANVDSCREVSHWTC